MSGPQIVYAIALAGLIYWRGLSFVPAVLLGNMAAALAGSWAMDVGLLDRHNTTLTMMLIDFVSAVFLLTRPGLPRVIAVGFGITVPIYGASVIFGISENTTFAVVIAVGLVQIMVAGIGADSDDRGNGDRRSDVGGALPSSGGNHDLAMVDLAQTVPMVSVNSRGLNNGPR